MVGNDSRVCGVKPEQYRIEPMDVFETKLRIAIITQAVDITDSDMGFFHNWIKAFALKCEKVFVICLKKGSFDLPQNVRVFQLRENKVARFVDFKSAMQELVEESRIDVFFAHMCPIYAVAASWFTIPVRKPLGLWFVHGDSSNLLRLANKLSTRVYSCAPECFPVKTRKLEVLGHGIDTEKFQPAPEEVSRRPGEVRILSTGRINTCKNYEVTIKAIKIIKEKHPELHPRYRIVGGPYAEEDFEYKRFLEALTEELELEDEVELAGEVSYEEIERHYNWCDIAVNMTVRLGLDKAVLEPMACGKPVITTNYNFENVLADFRELMLANENDSQDMAEKIVALSRLRPEEFSRIGAAMREIVINDHSLERLVDKFIESFKKLGRRRKK